MGRIIESTFVTLDGVIDEPHVWGQPYWDDDFGAHADELAARATGLLLGGETYEGMAEAWLSRAGDPDADRFNEMPKHVVTRAGRETAWNATVHEGRDALEVVRELREGDGTWLKYGTGALSAELLGAGLLDELHLWVFPCVAGSGARLLDGELPLTHLRVADTVRYGSGLMVHTLTPSS